MTQTVSRFEEMERNHAGLVSNFSSFTINTLLDC